MGGRRTGRRKSGAFEMYMDLIAGKKALMKKKLVQMRMERAFSGWNIQKLKLRKGKQISDFLIIVKLVVSFITHLSLLK